MKVTGIAVIAAAAVGAGAGVWGIRSGIIAPSAAHWQAWSPSGGLRIVPGLIILVLFSLYWSIASKDRAPDKNSESPWSALLHNALVNVGALTIILPVPGLTQRILSDAYALVICGSLIVAGGAVLAILARRSLGTNWSAEVRIAEAHRLVQDGPYRHLRHPIYTGALCMYLGLTIASGTLHALIGLLIIVLAYWRKTALEERILQREFGPEFDVYRRRSSALIPFVL
jgi:protein-S-isoprenylcysteine O-methyltransferase Ste14